MYCRNCGAQIEDGAKFCAACGAPVIDAPAAAEGGGARSTR